MAALTYISLFSGIGSCALASHDLGWTPIAFAEVEPFASAVLEHRFPNVPNVGDVTAYDWSRFRRQVDQPFSVAGDPITAHEARTYTHEGKNNFRTRNVVAFAENQRSGYPAVAFQPRYARNGRGAPDEIASALTSEAGRTGKGDSAQCVAVPSMQVRRLTPRECEALQGLPRDWTLVPYNGKPAKDSPRYRAIGNGWAVPVVAWIFRRLDLVERELKGGPVVE